MRTNYHNDLMTGFSTSSEPFLLLRTPSCC